MVNEIEIRKVDFDNIVILEQFVNNIGNSDETFRYFKSRPLSIISNHLLTVVVLWGDVPVAYGHLDKEDEVIWLGIAVSENSKGKGLGNLVMKYLIDYADIMKIEGISLSVDVHNTIAYNLYKKFDFKQIKLLEKTSTIIMKRSNK